MSDFATTAIHLQSASVVREVQVSDEMTSVEHKDYNDLLEQLKSKIPWDSGFMPPGVLSIRQAGNTQQVVLQLPPSAQHIVWGRYERSEDAQMYSVAQPYRIIMGQFLDGQFQGARHFYSPEPVNSFDAPLYHQNVPNLNCLGYQGTSVGWICLYHRDDTTQMDVGQRAAYVALRASGNEAYNDANMSSTDGARFYQSRRPDHTYLWDPKQWDRKTAEEGVTWTLDPNLWIPVMVRDIDNQDAHYDDETAVPLTLRMALEGHTRWYYREEPAKLMNELARGTVESKQLFKDVIAPALQRAKNVKTEMLEGSGTIITTTEGLGVIGADPELAEMMGAATTYCAWCEDPAPNFVQLPDGKICQSCFENAAVSCEQCGISGHSDDMMWHENMEQWYCGDHFPASNSCGNCGYEWDEQNYYDPSFVSPSGCANCEPNFSCNVCGSIKLQSAPTPYVPVQGFDGAPSDQWTCGFCVENSVICEIPALDVKHRAHPGAVVTTVEGDQHCMFHIKKIAKRCATCNSWHKSEDDHCTKCLAQQGADDVTWSTTATNVAGGTVGGLTFVIDSENPTKIEFIDEPQEWHPDEEPF